MRNAAAQNYDSRAEPKKEVVVESITSKAMLLMGDILPPLVLFVALCERFV